MTNNVYNDISNEKYRKYIYFNKSTNRNISLKIRNPKSLYLSNSGSGSHRVITKENKVVYVKPGWLAIVLGS